MSRFLLLIGVVLGLLVVTGGYWVMREKEVAPVSVLPVDEAPETLEAVLARAPVSPINVSSGQAAWPTAEIDGEMALIQKTLTQPLADMDRIGDELLQNLKKQETLWCAPYFNSPFLAEIGDTSWSTDYLSQLVEDTRTERSAKRSLETEKQYEAWSLWLVALGEQAELKENKKIRKPLERFQKDFDEITDAYEEDLAEALETVSESFDTFYSKQSQPLRDPFALFRTLGTLLTVTHGQKAGCPDMSGMTALERGQLEREIRVWQTKIHQQLKSIKAGEGESVRLATQAATRFQTQAQQHENTLDAAKGVFLRSVKE